MYLYLVYLPIYESLYDHRNYVILQLYKYLYLGIHTLIRVVIFVKYKWRRFFIQLIQLGV